MTSSAPPRHSRRQVFDDAWPVAAETLQVDSWVAPHSHDFLEVLVVVSGSVEHRTSDGVEVLGPGDVAVLRPGVWHALEQCRELVVVNIYLGPELLHSSAAWILELGSITELLLRGGVGRITAGSLESITSQARQLQALRGAATNRMRRVALLGCLCSHLEPRRQSTISPTPAPEWMGRVVDEVTADLEHPWSTGDMAARAGLSSGHFHRKFRAATGMTPGDWLSHTRAEWMAVALIGSTATIAAIARSVGWGDANYATRRFRQLMGMPPSTYRRNFAFTEQAL